MTTDRPWADLPNAKHIDAVLADVKARPEVWEDAWDIARTAAGGARWSAALGAARVEVGKATWIAVRCVALRDVAQGIARIMTYGTINVLIA